MQIVFHFGELFKSIISDLWLGIGQQATTAEIDFSSIDFSQSESSDLSLKPPFSFFILLPKMGHLGRMIVETFLYSIKTFNYFYSQTHGFPQIAKLMYSRGTSLSTITKMIFYLREQDVSLNATSLYNSWYALRGDLDLSIQVISGL